MRDARFLKKRENNEIRKVFKKESKKTMRDARFSKKEKENDERRQLSSRKREVGPLGNVCKRIHIACPSFPWKKRKRTNSILFRGELFVKFYLISIKCWPISPKLPLANTKPIGIPQRIPILGFVIFKVTLKSIKKNYVIFVFGLIKTKTSLPASFSSCSQKPSFRFSWCSESELLGTWSKSNQTETQKNQEFWPAGLLPIP